MSYVDPTDAVSNTIATAADFNVVTADIRDLNTRVVQNTFSGCYLRRTTTRAIPSDGSYVSIAWPSEAFDADAWHTAGASAIVVPAAAIPTGFTSIFVRVDVWARYDTNNLGVRRTQVTLNGAGIDLAFSAPGLNGENTVVQGFWITECVAADVFVVEMAQTTGAALSINRAACAVTRLGAGS